MTILKNLLPVLVIVGLFAFSGCKKDDEDNTLKAAFTFQLTENPGEVVFTNQSSNAQTYEWNYGDGTSTTVTSPTHVYDQNDSYIVILKAFGAGTVTSVQDTVLVNNVP